MCANDTETGTPILDTNQRKSGTLLDLRFFCLVSVHEDSRVARWLSVLHRYTAVPLSPVYKPGFESLTSQVLTKLCTCVSCVLSCDIHFYHTPEEYWQKARV